MQKEKFIKLGIICHSPVLKEWEAKCIEKLLTLDFVKLTLVFYFRKQARKLSIKEIIQKGGLLIHIYSWFFFKPKSFANRDLSPVMKKAPRVFLKVDKNLSEIDLSTAIKLADRTGVNLLISFLGSDSNNILSKLSDHLNIKFGTWRYLHGKLNDRVFEVPYFKEVCNSKVSSAYLVSLCYKNNGYRILREGHFRTINTSFSKNCDYVLLEIANWAADACREIVNMPSGLDNVHNIRTFQNEEKIKAGIKSSNTIPWFLQLFVNKLKAIYRSLFIYEDWNIGYVKISLDNYLLNQTPVEVNWLFPKKKGCFYADPFMIKSENKIFIIGEKYLYRKKRAEIFAAELEEHKIREEFKVNLDIRHHVSYPCVFKWGGNIFLCVEEWKSNRISLYKSVEFPIKWDKVRILMDNIDAIDPTIFKYKEFWWLFFTKKNDYPETKLYAYYSNNLADGWEPHRRNPIKIDVRSSRPAGNVMNYNGYLIRPAQDCSKFYGWRIILNKIIRLSPDSFKEEPFKIIDASGFKLYNKGTHTFNYCENYITLDGLRFLFSLKKALRKIFK